MKMNLTRLDRFLNIFTPKKSKIKMRCNYCTQGIFNLDTPWGETGQCINCYEAEERGKQGVKNMNKIKLELSLPLTAVETTDAYMLVIRDAEDVYHFFKKDGTYDGYDKKVK